MRAWRRLSPSVQKGLQAEVRARKTKVINKPEKDDTDIRLCIGKKFGDELDNTEKVAGKSECAFVEYAAAKGE